MYKYILQWPKDRKNGWSDELNGVCHDNDNWFFTQNGILWKFPVTHRIGDTVTAENKAKGILRNKYGYHLGDIDCYNDFLFIPVTGDKKSYGDGKDTPYIAVFSANNLSFITKQRIQKKGEFFQSIGWCAINPRDKYLYTSDSFLKEDFSGRCSPVLIYDIDLPLLQAIRKMQINPIQVFNDNWQDENNMPAMLAIRQGESNFLKYRASLVLRDEKGNAMTLEHMQGGCFDDENHLHTTNGLYTGVKDHWANSKGGISVFTVPSPISANITYYTNRIAKSGQSGTFCYQFNGIGEEPEGITYWNLNRDKRAPEISGVLHAIMLDNTAAPRDDTLYFKHYDRVYEVYGAIKEKWVRLGGEKGFLGHPLTDETATPDKVGRYNHFQGGSIYWTPTTGAYEVHGAIIEKWASLGWERGFLGYPLTDETATPDKVGRYNHFQGGSIYWTPTTGAYEVHGAIKEKWASLGWERGFLRYPLTDEIATPDKVGRYNHFQGGSIYWTPTTGACAVNKKIRDEWERRGWERGSLGYPTSDTSGTEGTTLMNKFQKGSISWSQTYGYKVTLSNSGV